MLNQVQYHQAFVEGKESEDEDSEDEDGGKKKTIGSGFQGMFRKTLDTINGVTCPT